MESVFTRKRHLDNDASVAAGFAEIMNNIEAVELFINNAGIMYVGMTEAYSIEQASEQMNTNYFFSQYAICRQRSDH